MPDSTRQGFSALKLIAALAVMVGVALVCAWFQPAGSPIFALVENGDSEGVRKLLKADPGQIHAKYMGRTPLHLAVIKDHRDLVTLLVASGAGLEARDAFGNTPLHLAAHCLRLPVARYLLGQGAQAGARNKFGDTPLHHVAYAAYDPLALQIAGLLIAKGAAVEAMNNQGYTPAKLAGFNQRWNMVKFLQKMARQAHQPRMAEKSG